MKQIANDTNIVQFAINPYLDYFSRNLIIANNLKNISTSNEFIESIYVYGTLSNSVFYSNGSLYNLKDFYDAGWKDVYETENSPVIRMNTRKILSNDKNVISFVANIPYNSASKLGAVVININEEKLFEVIKGMQKQEDGDIFAINGRGKIVTHSMKEKIYSDVKEYSYIKKILEGDEGSFTDNYDGRKTLITYVTSKSSNWKYIYAVPAKNLQADSRTVTFIIAAITLIYILLSLYISFNVTKGIYNPIEKLIGIVLQSKKLPFIEDNINVKNEYDFLGYAYNNVVDENYNMEKMLEHLKPAIKEKLFLNLIFGTNESQKEINEKLTFLELELGTKNFVAIAVQIDEYKKFCEKFDEVERSLKKVLLKNVIEKIIFEEYKGVCIEAEPDKFAVIINFNENSNIVEAQEEAVKYAEMIKVKVNNIFPFTVTLGIGRIYEDLLNIRLSFEEALYALKYKLYLGLNEVIKISDIQQETHELYFYQFEKEKLIINNLKIGNQREVNTLINELLTELQSNTSIPYEHLQQIFARITGTMAEVLVSHGLTIEEIFGKGHNLYKELSKRETIPDIRIWLSEVAERITNGINASNLSKIDRNVEKIIEYINEHISEEVSLNDIAEIVGLSPSYISRVFKESIGRNYLEYLSESRISKAKQLLSETNFTLREIGFKVGFNNIQTFMRTFKKYEGITPGQYRGNSLFE